MATFLDISILGQFTAVFTFLLVFVILFGLQEVFNVFGSGHRGLHAIIAACVGFLVIFSSGVVKVIQTFTPWFVIVIILIFFILFAVRMFGVSEADITHGFKEYSSILTFILIFAAVILLFSLGAGFGQESLQRTEGNLTSPAVVDGSPSDVGSTATTDYNKNLYNTLYHPKVLGLMLIMLIVVSAMLLLTSTQAS
jgi:hypothetical protein